LRRTIKTFMCSPVPGSTVDFHAHCGCGIRPTTACTILERAAEECGTPVAGTDSIRRHAMKEASLVWISCAILLSGVTYTSIDIVKEDSILYPSHLYTVLRHTVYT
jgi:hypothetical protein